MHSTSTNSIFPRRVASHEGLASKRSQRLTNTRRTLLGFHVRLVARYRARLFLRYPVLLLRAAKQSWGLNARCNTNASSAIEMGKVGKDRKWRQKA